MKENQNILQRVRKIEIKTRGLSNDIFAGKYHSAFKGRGMAFSEVRDYRIGDDIRDIDWNVTARTGDTHIKVFEEERELTLMLLVDVSGSGSFGTVQSLKRSLATELAAVLAFSAAQNNDKIGCIFFSDRVEKYIPAKKGRQHVLRIISELVDFQPQGKGTDVGAALKFFSNVVKKRCTAFLISDLMDVSAGSSFSSGHDSNSGSSSVSNYRVNFEDAIKIAALKHDLVALQVMDRHDASMPNVGVVEFEDAETGQRRWVDTSRGAVREAYAASWQRRDAAVRGVLSRNSIDSVAIATGDDYVKALIRLFKMR